MDDVAAALRRRDVSTAQQIEEASAELSGSVGDAFDKAYTDVSASISGAVALAVSGVLATLSASLAPISGALPSDVLLGRDAAGTGSVAHIHVSGGLEFTGLNGIRRSLLQGFVTATAGSVDTTSAEPIISFTASPFMTNERVATSSTSVAVSTGTVGQVEWQRSALTGFVTASANANETTSGDPLITWGTSPNLTNERVLSPGVGTLINSGTAGQVRVDVDNLPLSALEDIQPGRVVGLQVDAAGAAAPVQLTGAEQGENVRFFTSHTANGSADLTDYVPSAPGIDAVTHIFIDPSANINFNSLTTPADSGKQVRITKLANTNLVRIVDEATTGSAAMRFRGIGNTTTPNIELRHDGANVLVEYRSDFERWLVVEWNPGIATVDNAGLVTPSTSLPMSASTMVRAALTGIVTASQDSNTTTSGDPFITWGSSPNMTNERILSGGVGISVNLGTAGQAGLDLSNMAAGTAKGRQIDAGTGAPVDLTGVEQGENVRFDTRQTVAVSGTVDLQLNDDTTVLSLQLAADTTFRSLNSSTAGSGRLVRIEHDTGNFLLTFTHNSGAPTYSPFFNPEQADVYMRRGGTLNVRSRSGFWRPEYPWNNSTTQPVITTEATGGTLTDYALPSSTTILDITATTALTGMAGGREGRRVIVSNGSAAGSGVTVTLIQFATSAAGNRLLLGKATTKWLYPGDSTEFIYRSSRWWEIESSKQLVRANSSGLGSARTRTNYIDTTTIAMNVTDVSGSDEVSVSPAVVASSIGNTQLSGSGAGIVKGRQVDASGFGALVDLTGLEVGELIRYDGLAFGTFAGGTYNNWPLTSITNGLFITPSGSVDVTITGFAVTGSTPSFTTNVGFEFMLMKEGFNGRVVLKDNTGSASGNRIFTPGGGPDYVLSEYGDAVMLRWTGTVWHPQAVRRPWVRVNSTGTGSVRSGLNLIVDSNLTASFTEDAAGQETEVTFGMAPMAQARIKGRWLTSGTGAPADLTGGEVLDVLEPFPAVWTASHVFSGSTHHVFTTGMVSVLGAGDVTFGSTVGGAAISAGPGMAVESSTVGNGDVVVNASSGIILSAAPAAAVPSVAAGDIILNAAGGLGLTAGVASPPIDIDDDDIYAEAFDDIDLIGGGDVRIKAGGVSLTAGVGTQLVPAAGTLIMSGSADVILNAGGGVALTAGIIPSPTNTGNLDITINAADDVIVQVNDTETICTFENTARVRLEPDVYVYFGASTGLPSTGDVRKVQPLEIASVNNVSIVATGTTGSIDLTAADDLRVQSGALLDVDCVDLDLDASNVAVISAGSQLILTASDTVDINSPHRLNSLTAFTNVQTVATAGTINNLALNGNVLRLTGASWSLTGMVPWQDGQVVLIVNASSTVGNVEGEHASSTAANRFAGIDHAMNTGMVMVAWYDGTLDRWCKS